MAVEDPNLRIQQLSQKLSDKERELVACQNSQAFLKQDLESARAELTAAREELRNEATKTSLLEQRLKRITDELHQTRNDLASSVTERDNLNRTLGRVHDQLNNFKSESTAKGIQLTELQLHYDGLLVAKEESIRSLQALLESQQKQLQEQHAVWEEEKRSLKASLMGASSEQRAAASHLALAQAQSVGAAAQSAALADLRAKLAAAEAAALKASEREHKLVELVRHRERQVMKLKQKRNSQGGRNTATGGAARASFDGTGGNLREGGARDRGAGDGVGGSATMRHGGRVLFAAGVSSDEDSLFTDTATSLELSAASPLPRSAATTVATKGSSSTHSPGNSRTAVLQTALQEERRRRGALRSRLAVAEQEADELRMQMSRLRAEVVEAAAAGGSNVQIADELLRAQRKIQDLEADLRRARDAIAAASEATASTSPSASGSRAGGSGGPGLLTSAEHLAIVRQRLMRQRQEFEQLLERVLTRSPGVMRGSPSGVLLPEDIKGLLDRHLSRIDTLASMSALPEGRRPGSGPEYDSGGGSGPHQHQHSLFVVRAAWSTLRKALITLQEAVASSLDVSANPAVAYLQGADFLSRIMREWSVGDKVVLDTAVEASMSAAVALVQEAAVRLQSHAVDAGVMRQQLQEAHDEVAQLRLTNTLVQAEGDRRLAETRLEIEELRRTVEVARSEVAVVQREAAVRLRDLEAARARADAAEQAVHRAEAAAAAVDLDRSRLRKNLALLEGDKGNAEAMAQTWEDERLRLTRALGDANATIALLHDRLDTYQASGNSQVTALKQKIRDVVTALESPSLPQLHAMMVAAAADGDAATAAADGVDLAAAAAAGVGPARNIANHTPRRVAGSKRGGGVLSEASLNSLAMGMHAVSGGGAIINGASTAAAAVGSADDPITVSSSLVAALDSAAVSCSAALHRMALLEMAHHEVDRGVATVAAIRSHLASATAEMAAGRLSFGDVLLTELLSMMDDATSVPPSAAGSAAGAPTALTRGSAALQTPRARSASSAWPQSSSGNSSALALRAQLATARDQSQHLMRHLKNMEGLILALKSALPEWLELATARLAARHRTELSRMRGVLGGQLAALRRDLREMKASCHATMAEAAAQAEDALQQARRMAAAADVDRQEATEHLKHLTKDLHTLTEDLSSIAAATAAAAGGSGANPLQPANASGPPSSSPGTTNHVAEALAKAAAAAHAGGDAPASGLAYSLVRAVAEAVRVFPALREGCEKIRRDAIVLVSERDRARAAAGAAITSTTLVVKSVAEAVPLPEMLVMALLNQFAAPDQSLTPFWCAKMRECVAGQMTAMQAAAVEGVVKGQVEPLRRDVERLHEELKTSKRRVAVLQAQATRFLEESSSALDSCRRAAGEAAAAVLDSVMAGVREEVAAVRMQVSDLEAGSSDVLHRANAAWSEQLAAVRASSSAAVAALEESVALLQEQLGSEADAYDTLKAESDAAVKEASERVAVEQQRIRALHADLAVAKERLAGLEAAETNLEGENRGLRKALRQREVLAIGLMQQQQSQPQQQQQDDDLDRQQQQQQRRPTVATYTRGGLRDSPGA